MSGDLSEIQKRIIKFRDERAWKQFHNPKDLSLSLVLEAVEVMEHFQWKTEEEAQKHIAEHKDSIGDELADVLYWVLLMANDLDIDLYEASERKLKKNGEKYEVSKSKGNHKKYTELQ
jgi:NTP pyrophosphatase (non-canonical NTP hydrolase)